jgi:hypothetical protein
MDENEKKRTRSLFAPFEIKKPLRKRAGKSEAAPSGPAHSPPFLDRVDVTKLLDLDRVRETARVDAVVEALDRACKADPNYPDDVASILEREERGTLTPEKITWARFDLQYHKWLEAVGNDLPTP